MIKVRIKSLKYVPRSHNKVAQILAGHALQASGMSLWVSNPPEWLNVILCADAMLCSSPAHVVSS